ncbi:phage tail protein [Azospirillum sp. TSH64]|uniref:phage tail protein n=1 Tax=Azospirillum sp. TSH64 TaxID=652740 RepID=UPI000D64B5F9|nr:phage tail protein [Azospirillum sp. TSH64]
MSDLLPPNATDLERDASSAIDYLARFGASVPAIRTAKRIDIPDSFVPWLIYEYGLGELLPFLTDPRRALAEGVLWQRVRGTPAALRTALGWIDFVATVEEEGAGEGAGTLRWSEFQLGLDRAPADLAFVERVVEIARLSAPIRSRLSRVYGGLDLRRVRLDHTGLSDGSLLSDYSGVRLRDDWPVLSFGRAFAEDIDASAISVEPSRAPSVALTVQYGDRFLLDANELGAGWHEPNHASAHGHLFAISDNEPLPDPGALPAPLKFSRAQIVLSDSEPLGSSNACFPVAYWRETGGVLDLSSGGAPSSHSWGREAVPVPERLERGIGDGAQYVDPAEMSGGGAERLTVVFASAIGHWPILSEPPPLSSSAGMGVERVQSADGKLEGQYWTSARWPSSNWSTTREIIGASHGSSN